MAGSLRALQQRQHVHPLGHGIHRFGAAALQLLLAMELARDLADRITRAPRGHDRSRARVEEERVGNGGWADVVRAAGNRDLAGWRRERNTAEDEQTEHDNLA